MPTTVEAIFNNSSIEDIKKIKWGKIIQDKNDGVYIVSMSSDPAINSNPQKISVFNLNEIEEWIDKLPNFRIDNKVPTVDLVVSRLSEFWLPDENILYIGKAPKRKNGDALGNRIEEYYKTEIGDKWPHSGGQWIKVLKNLSSLYVYYGYCFDPAEIEKQMLVYFMTNVSKITLVGLRDKKLPLPFANIRYKPRVDKNHGLISQRKI